MLIPDAGGHDNPRMADRVFIPDAMHIWMEEWVRPDRHDGKKFVWVQMDGVDHCLDETQEPQRRFICFDLGGWGEFMLAGLMTLAQTDLKLEDS